MRVMVTIVIRHSQLAKYADPSFCNTSRLTASIIALLALVACSESPRIDGGKANDNLLAGIKVK
jgi:hypothetical protein